MISLGFKLFFFFEKSSVFRVQNIIEYLYKKKPLVFPFRIENIKNNIN